MKLTKKGFTIVELIVVIVILWILSTLWFVSFSWYSSWVRDANRIAQINWISSSLSVYNIKNFLPLPDDYILLEVNWKDIAYQWFAWKELLEEIDYKKWWKDPKDDKYYTYYITKSRKDFQLLAFLSKQRELSNTKFLSTAYSDWIDYSNRIPYVEWKRLWVLLQSHTNLPIQEIDSLQSVKKLDLWLTSDNYKAVLKNWDIVEWDSSVLSNLKISALAWWKWCSWKTWNIVCDWSSPDIPNNTIVWNDTIWRTWSGWLMASYCDDYRHPVSWYEYSWDIWDWIYWIDPANDWVWFKVLCDMTSDWWWWTYTTMLADTTTKNLFDTWNSDKVTSISSGISTKWNIATIWLDDEDKDIMLVCKTTSIDHSNYEIPFFIYWFQKVDIWNLTKQHKVGPPPSGSSVWSGTVHLSSSLSWKWNWNTFALNTNFWDSSLTESYYISKLWVPWEWGYLFMLRWSMQMALYPSAALEWPCRKAPDSLENLNSANYCMTAIR